MRLKPSHLLSLIAVAFVATSRAQTIAERVVAATRTEGAIVAEIDSTSKPNSPELRANVRWLRPDGTAILLSNDARSVFKISDHTFTPADARSTESPYTLTERDADTPGRSSLEFSDAIGGFTAAFSEGVDSSVTGFFRGSHIHLGYDYWFSIGNAPTAQRNFSNRGYVSPQSPAIAGFVLEQARWALVRVVGPTLGSFGVAEACDRPVMEIHSGGHVRVVRGWRHSPGATSQLEVVAQMAGAFPLPGGSH
ncbi:MAG TPA: hypothetical protein VHF69_02485, partial [Candidatus Synoicihabitans sp.]|nr:hypothetical protein [Candidatus Synoicihabitans sp.]